MKEPNVNYATTSAAGVSPIGLVIRLYETAVADLGRAVTALKANDIEKRTGELQHALAIVGQLQASLDMNGGGDPAKQLDRFYDMVRSRIIDAQVQCSTTVLEQVMRDLLLLRDTWAEVDRQTNPAGPSPKSSPPSSSSAWFA